MYTLKINNEKFDFYMQIINIYFLYYNIKDEINKNKDYNNIMINLNKIKKFLNNLILILQTLITNNSNFSKMIIRIYYIFYQIFSIILIVILQKINTIMIFI